MTHQLASKNCTGKKKKVSFIPKKYSLLHVYQVIPNFLQILRVELLVLKTLCSLSFVFHGFYFKAARAGPMD